MTASTLPKYDTRVIEQFAENLYRKASAFVVGSVAVGAALGAAFGAVPLTSLGDSWPIPSIFGFATLLVGGIFGGVIGYVIGDTRSFGYRLQAQTALCQLQTERNTAMLAKAIMARVPAQQPARQVVAPPARQPGAPPPVAPPHPQQAPPVQQAPPSAVPPVVQPPVVQPEPVEAPVPPPVSAARVA